MQLSEQVPTGGTSRQASPDLSIVVAMYNEEAIVPEFIARLCAALNALDPAPTAEIIAVDDGSSDATLQLLKLEAAKEPRLRVVELACNVGQLHAVNAGLSLARGNWVAMMDGDLQHDPADLSKFWKECRAGIDLIGSYRETRIDSWKRRAITWTANRVNRFMTGCTVKDFGSSYRVISARLLRTLKDRDGVAHFSVPEIYTNSRRRLEIPVQHHKRGHGQSKWTFSQFLAFNMDFFMASSRPPELLILFSIFSAFLGLVLYIVNLTKVFGDANAVSAPVDIVLTSVVIGLLAIIWREVGKIKKLVGGTPIFEIVTVWSSSGAEGTTALTAQEHAGR
jgi:undecaprenyl-phosphate 4-deoxy-4-formamido-L-arabinose transferase